MLLRRWLALAYLLLLSAYSVLWIHYMWQSDDAPTTGLELEYQPSRSAALVRGVRPGAPGARAGLQAGDHLLAVDGVRLTTIDAMHAIAAAHEPGDRLVLTVLPRDGAAPRDVSLQLVRRGDRPPGEQAGMADRATPAASAPSALLGVVLSALSLYPLPFLIVSIFVLLQRPDDRNAWAMALTFGGFIGGAPLLPLEPILPPWLRGPAIGFAMTLAVMMPAVLYSFLAVFPAPSAIDRRVPWLKHTLVAVAALVAVPLGVACVASGGSTPLWWVAERIHDWPIEPLVIGYNLCAIALALASLTANAFGTAPETRRKTQVILAGAVGALLPLTLLNIWIALSGRPPTEIVPLWAWAMAVGALSLLPISVAYAVVKHRVMELPVLLRRSARYLLVRRGALTLAALLGVAATLAFAALLERWLGGSSALSRSGGLVAGSLFGGLLALTGERLWRPAEDRIDRAFFRGSYDARRLLEALAVDIRLATDRASLAAFVERALEDALQPRALHVYLRAEGPAPRLEAAGQETESLAWLPIALDLPALAETARKGQPLVVDPDDLEPGGPLAACAALAPEVLVPMVGRGGQLEGLIVLGPRLSDETYSGEDRALVQSAATQAALALENIRLAETMAARMEQERRVAREMEIAKAVQAKLLPQDLPAIDTLDYAAACVQARHVGGDYYDFVRLADRRVGLVLADISGKGISAALLMASLQASLRAQYTQAPADLRGVLCAVNQQFFESTATNHYATLFFGIYDSDGRRLRYANCGHLPPVLLRADGSVARLPCTAPVVGLFDAWDCATAEVAFGPRDVLVVFSDGVSEAQNAAGEEFGEERLIELVRSHGPRGARPLVDAVLEAVRAFGGDAQYDDVTLIAARGR